MLPFFHYTSLEGIKGIIENKEMWASHINFLNDKNEWLHFDSVIKDAIYSLELPYYLEGKVYDNYDDILKFISPFERGRINEFNFILSFSTVSDCKSQWMEYCPRFSGYALEFSEFPVLNWKKQEGKIYNTAADEIEPSRCIYDKLEQVEKIKSVLTRVQSNKKDSDFVKFEIATLLADLRYKFKHHGFSEEKEYRWYGRSDSNMDIRVKNGVMVPYVHVPIDITKLSAIWVGPSPVQDKAAQGLSFWWSILQRNDSSYIYKNDKTGIISIRKSEIPYSFI